MIAAGAIASGQAQTFTNILVSSFDTATDPYLNMVHWWGGDVWSVTWDGTQNCPSTLFPNTPGSGALKITLDWTDTSPTTGNQQPQFCFLDGLSGGGWNITPTTVDGFYYDLDFDIKFDPSSARSANDGSFGNIQAGFGMPDWSQRWVWFSNGFTNQGWTHIHAYVDPTLPNINQIAGFAIYQPWQTSGSTNAFYTNATQVQTFWLDNIAFTTNLTKPLAPPKLTLAPVAPTPGLNIQTTAAAGTYDRDNIATVSGNYSWVGAGSSPVTYSVTIGKYPDNSHPYFQTHIFLASGTGGALPGTESAPDWNEPNCVFLQIQNNADGTASARFMYKIDDPGANDMLWNTDPTKGPVGTIGTLYEPAGVLGTWAISFVNDTNITLTSPTGLSTNFFFPDDAAIQGAFPQGSVVAYFGGQPNADANKGQGIVLGEVKISGPGLTPIDDHFNESALDTTVWVLREAESTAVSLVHNDVHWKLGWSLPDLHFQAQSAPSVLGPWTDAGFATNAVQSGATKSVLVPDAALPSNNTGYFRMIKRVATKLQVLMPGETAAPGTPLGKTGAPTAFNAGEEVDVIVNAVDDNWNLITYNGDTVTISSTDATAVPPSDAALVNGTGTFPVYFGTAGTWTVTATDVSDSAKKPGTGSPVTIH